MSVTLAIFVLLGLMLVGLVFFQAALLQFGLKWVRAQSVTFRKCFNVTLVLTLLQIGVMVSFWYLAAGTGGSPLEDILEFLISLLLDVCVVRIFFGVTTLRALKAYLPTLAGSIVVAVLTIFLFQPFVGEAFVTPTNSMAPTILGRHFDRNYSRRRASGWPFEAILLNWRQFCKFGNFTSWVNWRNHKRRAISQ